MALFFIFANRYIQTLTTQLNTQPNTTTTQIALQ